MIVLPFNQFLVTIGQLATPVLVICAVALGAGILLTVAEKVFAVQTDPKANEVRDALPGINCGACGYVGCDEYAKAVAGGEATNLCIPGGSSVVVSLNSIMGQSVSGERKIEMARVQCQGDCNRAKNKYQYTGIQTCAAASQLHDGQKSCAFGCLGLGDCVKACPFDAIDIVNDIAVIDEKKCMSCRKCVPACPKKLISMVDQKVRYTVLCQSTDKAVDVRRACTTGCIACTRCVKACPVDAIRMKGALAYIDDSLCINCGACAKACPTNAIINIDTPPGSETDKKTVKQPA